jgi:DNA-binding response OmpR family regulator
MGWGRQRSLYRVGGVVSTHPIVLNICHQDARYSGLFERHRWHAQERETFLDGIDKGLDENDRLLEYGQQLLALEQGLVRFVPRPTDVHQRVQQILQSMAIRNSGCQFNTVIAESLPSLHIDPRLLDRILHYMFECAIDRSPPQGVVTVAVQQSAGNLVISVTDQGTGLLQKFGYGQIGNATSGAALGLSVATELAKLHGGRIWTDQPNGHGQTAHCELPFQPRQTRESDVVRPLSVPAPARKPTKARSARNRCTILLATNNSPNMRLLQNTLENDGYEVFPVNRGSLALEQALYMAVDLVLVDMQLPDMSPVDLCSQIREQSDATIIVLNSNNRQYEEVARLLDSGADGYLNSPFDRGLVLSYVRAMIRRNATPESEKHQGNYVVGDLVIAFQRRIVLVCNRPVKLSSKEFKLLALLVENAGRVLSHNEILAKVWGPEYKDATANLWVTISRLRRKLETDPASPRFILTESGYGYYIATPDTYHESLVAR